MLSLFFASCKDCVDPIIYNDDIEIIDGYYSVKSTASDEVVTHLTAVIGNIPNNIGTALNKRFTSQTSQIDPSNTRVIIFHISSLPTIDEEAFLEVYRHDGIIIVLEPDHELLSVWLENMKLNHPEYNLPPVTFSKTPEASHELYAFNQLNNQYILDYIDSDFDYNDFLNSLVSWVNEYAEGVIPPPLNAAPDDVRQLFSYQTIDYTYNLYLNKQEAKVALSSPDMIERSGQISIKYTIYPLYAFQNQASSGDYYIVNMRVTAHNDQMYQGNWTQKHGGVHSRLCGFYMEDLKSTTEIVTNGQSAAFAAYGTPQPTTTVGSTAYTSGVSWSLGASVSGTVGTETFVSATINAGVTFSNSQSRSISDVDVLNTWSGSNVNYQYRFNNLPSYLASIKISDPPYISVNNAEFYQDWIWYIPSTTDGSTERFSLRHTIAPQFGSCHFFSTGADFSRHSWTDAVGGSSTFTVALTPPNRVPTGQLDIIQNSGAGVYMTDIRIWKSTSNVKGAPDYVESRSYANGYTMIQYLPVGDYWIEFKAGPNPSSLSTYHLDTSNGPISIIRGGLCTLNSGFDFAPGPY